MATSITNTSVTTDDLTVDTNVLHVDSTNNRVGIGTATPTQATLHVAGGNVPARFEGNTATTYVQFGASATTNYGQIAMNGNDMTLRTAYTDRMTIDSNGYVTKPNQPSFMARNHGQVANNANYVATGVTMICYTIDHNVGSHYSTSNGRFTAPIAGRYHFGYSIGIVRLNNGETIYPYFVKNGTQIHYQYYQNNSGGDFYGPISASCTFSLAANDYLSITIGGTGDWYAGAQETIMYGYLIG